MLNHATARQRAIDAVRDAPEGYVVRITQPKRSLDQNQKLHQILQCISDQLEWHGQRLPVAVWRRLCTAAWLRDLGETPTLVPALDGQGYDIIYERTSNLTRDQFSSLIDWAIAFGAEHGVDFG